MAFTNEYTAGLVDGEGCITLTCCKRRARSTSHSSSAIVRLANTDLRLITPLQEQWGGHVRIRKSASSRHKTCYVWELDSAACIPFLTTVAPSLVAKQEQAKIVLMVARINQARPHGGAYRAKPEWKMWIEELAVNKVRSLNLRGVAK